MSSPHPACEQTAQAPFDPQDLGAFDISFEGVRESGERIPETDTRPSRRSTGKIAVAVAAAGVLAVIAGLSAVLEGPPFDDPSGILSFALDP